MATDWKGTCGCQEQREESVPSAHPVGESPRADCAQGQRKRHPNQHGEKEADDLSENKIRRAETQATTNQRTFITWKRQTATGRAGHILL